MGPSKIVEWANFVFESLPLSFALTSSVCVIFPKYVVAFPAVWGREINIYLGSQFILYRQSTDLCLDISKARNQDITGLLDDFNF